MARKRPIQEAERVGRADHTNADAPHLFFDLSVQLSHFGPMDAGTIMVLRMVAVVKPHHIVQQPIVADAPRNREIRIGSVVPVVAVQIGKGMAEVIEGEKSFAVLTAKTVRTM